MVDRQPWLQVVPEPLCPRSATARVAQLLGHVADCPCPVPSCRCTRTTCTPRTANSTPLRRCFMRWGLSTPATWSSLPSIPPPRATWASMWAPASLPLFLGLPGPTDSPPCPASTYWPDPCVLPSGGISPGDAPAHAQKCGCKPFKDSKIATSCWTTGAKANGVSLWLWCCLPRRRLHTCLLGAPEEP